MFNFLKKLFTNLKSQTQPEPIKASVPKMYSVSYTGEVSKLLHTIGEPQPKGLRELSRAVNIPKDTLNRRLALLKELGVVDSEPTKNKIVYKLCKSPDVYIARSDVPLSSKYSVLFMV